MIRKLRLERFGKFVNREFDFNQVTLFHGPNEAGKTTIFDALGFALCGSKKNYPGLDRYGNDFSINADMDEDGESSFLHTEFLSLYAVKSDAVSMPKGDARWLDRIKNSFFSGGLDPDIMARDLDKALNSSKRKAEEAARKDDLGKSEGRLEKAKADLEEVRAARERAKETGEALKAARVAAQERAKARDAIAQKSEAMAARTRLAETRRTLSRIERFRFLSSASILKDESSTAKVLRAAIEEARRASSAAEAAERISAASLAEAGARFSADESAALASERIGTVARDIADKLEGKESPREVREKKVGTAALAGFILAAAVGIAAALALYAFGAGLLFSGIAAIAGVAIGSALLIGLRKTSVRMDDAESRSALESARAEWTRRSGGIEPPVASGPKEFLAKLRALESEAERKSSLLEDARMRKRKAAEDHAAAVSAVDAALRGAAKADAELSGWLRDRSASGYEDYIEKIAEAKALANERDGLRSELSEEAGRSGAEGIDGLQARLRQEAEAIERALPDDAAPAGASHVAESARLREAEAALEEARAAERAVAARWERESALAEKDMTSILLELARAEEKLESARKAVAEDDLLRSGESMARDIFRGMAKSSDAAFRGLSEAVESFYAPVAGGEGACRLSSLDEAEALVRDAGGNERAPADLSQGTKDLFYLACRLALARSMGRERAVLVFDEAFKNLDKGRTERALKMIGDFRERSGWSLVFLTKDGWLADAVAAGFPRQSLTRYDL